MTTTTTNELYATKTVHFNDYKMAGNDNELNERKIAKKKKLFSFFIHMKVREFVWRTFMTLDQCENKEM